MKRRLVNKLVVLLLLLMPGITGVAQSYSPGFGNQIFNASGLQPIKNKMRKADTSLVLIKVLHIGDSHIKAGYFSQRFMEKLNAFYAQRYKGNLFFNFQVFCKIGTKYSDYDELAELDDQLTREQPDLVIISLGTNDAFSGSARTNFYGKIDHLVMKVKKLSPGAVILFTTPSDALKKNEAGVYTTLPDLEMVVNTIIKYANDKGIAIWNLYQVMGGAYSINTWYQRNLAFPDRIHFNGKGYMMFGDWLFDAFTISLENKLVIPYKTHY